jgi:uncharacterized SAM-binding protein YcdF (DUF218 family)
VSRKRRRVLLILAGVLLLALGSLWAAREPLLAAVGRLVVEEGEPAPADLAVLLSNTPVLDAEEAARHVAAGHVGKVLILARRPHPQEAVARGLGIRLPPPHELAAQVLERLGVPPASIAVAPLASGGTNAAAREVARYARAHGARRLLVVTHRSHTRRTATLLRRHLGPEGRVVMRASPHDPYRAEAWWRDRESARELAMEGLRWANTILLGDLWGAEDRAPEGGGAAVSGSSGRRW